jgi:hypothetical protein
VAEPMNYTAHTLHFQVLLLFILAITLKYPLALRQSLAGGCPEAEADAAEEALLSAIFVNFNKNFTLHGRRAQSKQRGG